jgi:hypothetical protein
MSAIAAAQITAVATIALAALALAAAVVAGFAFWRQSQEVRILAEQNKRDTYERRRDQAARVFTVVQPDPPRLVTPFAHNASDFPVYDAPVLVLGP